MSVAPLEKKIHWDAKRRDAYNTLHFLECMELTAIHTCRGVYFIEVVSSGIFLIILSVWINEETDKV